MSFAENLKRLREAKKIWKPMLQTDLAKATCLSTPQISQYEHGGCDPKLPNLIKIAKALDVTIDELLKDEAD